MKVTKFLIGLWLLVIARAEQPENAYFPTMKSKLEHTRHHNSHIMVNNKINIELTDDDNEHDDEESIQPERLNEKTTQGGCDSLNTDRNTVKEIRSDFFAWQQVIKVTAWFLMNVRLVWEYLYGKQKTN